MRITFFALLAVFALSLPATLLGVDGVVLIDQNRAMAGNVTPGDTPGFPVTISQPGSYRLDSNLTVPDANTTAVEITTSNVTLDLNGFSIIGPTHCDAVLKIYYLVISCTAAGTGIGVESINNAAVKIMNGNVRGMGYHGIELTGVAAAVEKVNATSNGGSGIILSSDKVFLLETSILTDSEASLNQLSGASVQSGIVMRNRFFLNGQMGLDMRSSVGSVIDNYFATNIIYQLWAPTSEVQFRGNTFSIINAGAAGYVNGGFNGGGNRCDASTCP